MEQLHIMEEHSLATATPSAATTDTLRILLVHTGANNSVTQWHENIAAQAPPQLEVQCFPLAIPGFKHRISWKTLDLAWRCRHPALLNTYAKLKEAAQEADVLLLYGGYNLHPEFLSQLPTFNVYCFYDDPETSDKASRYIAPAFDAAFYCNVASRFQYEDWGCSRLAYLPIFTSPLDIPKPAEREGLQNVQRDNDIILCCGWEGGKWRRRRLQKLTAAFPQARCVGKGWPEGFLPHEELRDLYQRSRIGWNVHNSTGPINVRLFALAAWDILQICDNKTGLGEVFELGHEVIGFDTIEEAIAQTHYYLEHEEERVAIARRAYERYWRDYSPNALWKRIEGQVRLWSDIPQNSAAATPILLTTRGETTPLSFKIQSLGLSVKNTLARNQRSRLKRAGLATWPIDERFYLNEDVPYDPEQPFRPHPRCCSQRSPGHNPQIEQQVLAWSATAFLGQAQRIGVIGPSPAPAFIMYAGRDRGRELYREGDTQFLKADMMVLFGRNWSLPQAHAAAETIQSALIVLSTQDVATFGGCNTLYDNLTRVFDNIRLYWLPNPVVPWIEPLPGPLDNVAILATGTISRPRN